MRWKGFVLFRCMEIFGNNLVLAGNIACEVFFFVLVFVLKSITVKQVTGWWQGSKGYTKRMQFFQLKSSDPFHAWISFSCKPTHWGGTQLGKANERGRAHEGGVGEGGAERRKGNFERNQPGAKCFKMADVRRRRRPVPGFDASKDMKSCGQGGGQSEHRVWHKPQMVTLEHWQKNLGL